MEFDVRFIILLVGLFLVVLIWIVSKIRDWKSCLLLILGLGLCLPAGWFLVFEKWYQCNYNLPDQIRVAGHLKENSPNDYLVLLYKGDQEIDRFLTHKGQLESEDEARDGYFELTAANEFGLSRCSMAMDFEQERAGIDLLWMQNKTTYLWRDFTDLGAGAVQVLNEAEDRKTYKLVVSADKLEEYPEELTRYSTYLNRAGNIAINVPIQTYAWVGIEMVDDPTGFYIRPGRRPETPEWPVFPIVRDVVDAWVVDSNPFLTETRSPLDTHIVDQDNCGEAQPLTGTETVSLLYINEVQFLHNTELNFHLGVAADKADRSLGFMQGQIDRVTAYIPVDVPAGIYRKYKLIWHDVWSTGTMMIDFGQTNIRVPFRARTGMSWVIENYDVDCPQ